MYDFARRGSYNRRLFYLGDIPDMLLDEQFRKCVAFLYVDVNNPDTGKSIRTPIATAFFVSITLENEANFTYAVTARHVIDASRPHGPLYVRINDQIGGFEDFAAPQNQWILHPDTDVAIINVRLLPGGPWDLITIQRELFVTDDFVKKEKISAGDDLFFIGLFTEHPGKGRNQPIVRFGNISLMPHEKILIKINSNPNDSTKMPVDAYLAEARSWGGHSGSPAFIYFPPDRTPGTFKFGGSLSFALLGLVHGHYEIKQDVAFIGDILGSGTVPINAGMAVIIPAQKIAELLDEEKLAEGRIKILGQIRKARSVPKPD